MTSSMVKCDKEPNWLTVFKKVLKSYWMTAILLFLGLFCWITDNTMVCVFGYLAIFILTVLFSEDVKIIFCIVFYIPFFINDIVADPNWASYIGAIACAVVGLVCYLVSRIVLDGKNLKKGRMFYGFLAALLAFTVGGAARADLTPILVTWALFTATYVFYFIAVNAKEDLSKYLCYLFVVGSAVLIIQKVYNGFQNGGLISDKNPMFYCAENVNTVALFIAFGAVGAFGLGVGKKYDFLAIISMPIFLFGTIITRCRVAFGICALGVVAFSIMLIIFSPKKRYAIISIFAIVGVALLVCVLKREVLLEKVSHFLTKGKSGVSGRDELWEWCWQRFTEYPVLGFGMVSDTSVPWLRDVGSLNLVLAHNTVIQWLTSLGIIGSAFISVFYFYKYYAVLNGFNKSKIWAFAGILLLALAGTLDQSPTMDYFTFLLPLVCVASTEIIVGKKELLK